MTDQKNAEHAIAPRPWPIHFAERVFGAIAIGTVTGICFIMCWDVLFRYILVRPLGWSGEVIQFLMSILFFAALPLATLRGDHIIVDVLSERFTGVFKQFCLFLAGLLLTGYLLAMAWYCVGFARKLMSYGDRTDHLGWPLHLAAWAAAIAFVAAAIGGIMHSRKDSRQ
ncbi:TRAP transporter small permease [Martelella soudanensis]|uniref:TRAP transporter small permease n=1 Tax=unclassified Martelella TaxID=2629616 RepID=UPI0015DF0AD7|nr:MULTISPECIES: TRAP transporter small permease [unclassified Martelella]